MSSLDSRDLDRENRIGKISILGELDHILNVLLGVTFFPGISIAAYSGIAAFWFNLDLNNTLFLLSVMLLTATVSCLVIKLWANHRENQLFAQLKSIKDAIAKR